MNYSLSKIAEIVSGEIIGNNSYEIHYFAIDSRTLSSTDGVLFIALKGERHDAHRYIPELIEKGIHTFLISDKRHIPTDFGNCGFILVNDSLKAFQAVATYHRQMLDALVIGITGSNGKTIVKEWLFQALRKDRPVFRSPRSYNSQVGVPLSVLMIEDTYDLVILEAGISFPEEMDKIEKIICPAIGIITNIGEAHQENFISIEQKISEKLILFREAKTIIYCRDYELIHKGLKELYPQGKKLLCWGKHPESDFRITDIQQNNSGTRVVIEGNISFNFQIPFNDHASLENAMHFTLLLYELEYSAGFISKALLNLDPVAMRLEILKGIQNCTLINDSYNSDIVSLNNALDLLLQQNQHISRTLILSDILQSGRNETELYIEVAKMIKDKHVSKFVGIGPALKRQKELFPPEAVFFNDTDEFLNSATINHFKNEAILIKGARNFGFERISRQLQLKTHQTHMEIDMNAIIHNLNYYKSLLNPSTKIMAMVKAFSYGSGSFEIANLLQFHKVDYLAVAFIDEGYNLRLNGIRLPIMVMNPETGNYKTLIDNGLQPEIYSFESLLEFIVFLENQQIRDYPIHIKLETGMHRLGFSMDEIEKLASILKKPALKLESVFSHLAASDEPEHDDFTREQVESFLIMSKTLKKILKQEFMTHILNSSGIERFPEYQMDMVRLGIGLYGISGINPQKHIEASTFKTNISQIKELEKGVTVGYGRKGVVFENQRIATLPVGYADGIPRNLGNGKGNFVIRGRKTPIIGNICMDMCMVDITDIDAKIGDEVIIFGKEHPVTEIAKQAGTIPYEILSRISERVKRIYFLE